MSIISTIIKQTDNCERHVGKVPQYYCCNLVIGSWDILAKDKLPIKIINVRHATNLPTQQRWVGRIYLAPRGIHLPGLFSEQVKALSGLKLPSLIAFY